MVVALILAAGLSRRMGAFKLLLPWRESTVIEQVVATVTEAGICDILAVTGHQAEAVRRALGESVRCVFNPRYAEGDMISSIQAGLAALQDRPGARVEAALLCLGDQPQMEAATLKAVLAAGQAHEWRKVIIPSYDMHAGHPILLPRAVWPAVLATSAHLRDVLQAGSVDVHYVDVNSPTVLADLDTPDDYRKART